MKKLFIPKTPYTIFAESDGFSFGIDAVLLSEFAKMKKGRVMAEIGAGTGFVSMRCFSLYRLKKVYGVEIQEENIRLFERSVFENGLHGKVLPVFKNINDFELEQDALDYVVTNPPYYKKGSGFENKVKQDYLSRYEVEMEAEDIFIFAKKYLKVRGTLYMIHRPHRAVDLFYYGRKYKIEPKEMVPVVSRIGEECKMILLKFVKGGKEGFVIKEPFAIYEGSEYRDEVKAFYE